MYEMKIRLNSASVVVEVEVEADLSNFQNISKSRDFRVGNILNLLS